jgi:hypothetical protein
MANVLKLDESDSSKISKKIQLYSILQKDQDTIISWSREYNMNLHEDKFGLLNYEINS